MSETAEVLVPQTNPNDEHAVLVAWHVQPGDRVRAGDVIATLETTKATFDVSSPRDGFVFFEEAESSMVAVGAAIAWVGDTAEPPVRAAPAQAPGEIREPVASGEAGRVTRKALRLLQEAGLTESDFPAGQRIDVTAVEAAVARRAAVRAPEGASQPAPVDAERLEQAPTKMIEARMLAEVYRQIVPSSVSVAVRVRDVLPGLQRAAGGSLAPSVLELALHACAQLLPEYPDLNGFHSGGQAWRHAGVHVGFAVNIRGRGLRVPVVRDAASLSLTDTCRKVRDLTLRYMRNELALADLIGGSFTITDLSGTRVHSFVPVLNERQSAILGICAERPGSGHQDLVLAFDHRLSDGMRAAAFLDELVGRLEAAVPEPQATR